MENKYVVFIISHGRPNNIITLKTLNKNNYNGPVYIILDNEDKKIDEYKKIYGEDFIKVFDKKKYADLVDEGNNFDNRRTTAHARNACFDIADDLGYEFFLVLDDDYTDFLYRYENKLGFTPLIKNINTIFDYFFTFLKNTETKSIAFSQGGDHIGGFSVTKIKRKAMNSFFCSTKKRFYFVGQLNEDVNTYIILGSRGDIFFTYTSIQLNQKPTQNQAGGMTEAYLKYGTYIKTFTTILMHPSSVKVSVIGSDMRLHHRIKWVNTVPLILNEKYKK